jgi:hypothetical protein
VIINDSIASINEDWIKTGDYSNSNGNENEMVREEVAHSTLRVVRLFIRPASDFFSGLLSLASA